MSEHDSANCPMLVIMGVSGSGKSTLGARLARQLGWAFAEGDDFHPASNVAKMHAGAPLNDADRLPWLAAIATWMDGQMDAGVASVIACSALKRRYRDALRENRPQVWFLYPRMSQRQLERRLGSRHHPYMPASLLDSQLATLEEPAGEEPHTITLDAKPTVEGTLAAAVHALRCRNLVSSTTG